MDIKKILELSGQLTQKELRLCLYLASEPRHFKRREIIKAVWNNAACTDAFHKVTYSIRNKLGKQTLTYTTNKGYKLNLT